MAAVFLLSSFGSGEIAAARSNLVVPTATHARDLELAPIVAIDDRAVTLDDAGWRTPRPSRRRRESSASSR